MADAPQDLITDPDNVPVRVVNGLFVDVIGSVIALTANTARVGFDAEGKAQLDRVICARLRFDLEIAKMLRDQINTMIGILSPPAEGKPN